MWSGPSSNYPLSRNEGIFTKTCAKKLPVLFHLCWEKPAYEAAEANYLSGQKRSIKNVAEIALEKMFYLA